MTARSARHAAAWVLSLLTAMAALPAGAAQRDVFCDSAAPAGGNGTIGSPYNSLALTNWAAISNWAAAGDDVAIRLKCGSEFNQLLTVQASGTTGHPLRVTSYGSGPKPRIRGDTLLAGAWSSVSSPTGAVWSTPLASTPSHVWLADTNHLSQTNSVGGLTDLDWYWLGGTLYFRCDAGRPSDLGLRLTASARNNALLATSRHDLLVENIFLGYCSSYAIRLTTCDGVVIRGCDVYRSDSLLYCENTRRLELQNDWFDESYRSYSVNVSGALSSLRALYSVFRRADRADNTFSIQDGQSVSLINCDLVGSLKSLVYNSATAATVRVANCILTGTSCSRSSGAEAIRSVGSPVMVSHSLILPNGQNPKQLTSGARVSGRMLYELPRFVGQRREGILVLTEDDYPTAADWAQLAGIAEARGFRVTLSLSETDTMAPSIRNLLQSRIDRGHDIVSHTRSHVDLTTPDAFLLRYVGTGTECVVTIASNRLVSTVAGGPGGEDLSIDLKSAGADTESELVAALDAPASYACTAVTVYNHRAPSRMLAAVSGLSIKAAPVKFSYDRAAFYSNEVAGSRADIEAAFTNAGGGAYSCRYLNYPGGYSNTNVVNELMRAGYQGGRMTGASTWQLERLDIFAVNAAALSMFGQVLLLCLENNTADLSSQPPTACTGTNMAFSTDAHRLTYSGLLNGTNAWLTCTNAAVFDFSRGDWCVASWIKPSRLTGRHTLYHHSATNGQSAGIWLEADGALRVSVTSNGVERLGLCTPAGVVVTGVWQKVSIQEQFDSWTIRINDAVAASTTTTQRLPAFDRPVLIGCRRDDAAGTNTDFYAGRLDDFAVCVGTYMNTHAVADLLTEAGGVLVVLTHGETGMPRETWRIALDALRDALHGSLRVMPQTAAFDYIRSTGALQPDQRTVMRRDQGDSSDYRLRPDSPCVGAGDPAELVGQPDLKDMAGRTITDAAGRLVLGPGGVSMGAYEGLPDPVPPVLSDPASGVTYLLGSDWVTFSVAVTNGPLQKIEFYGDGVLLAERSPTNDPYHWSNLGVGDHFCYAILTYANGGSVYSVTNQIHVDNPAAFRVVADAAASDGLSVRVTQGNAGRRYVVQASSDLTAWSDLSAEADPEELLRVSATNDASGGFFVRARLKPR